MGLVHSTGTGLPYLGAGWTRDPLPATSDLAPLHTVAAFFEMYIPRLFLYLLYPANAAWQMAFTSEWGFMVGTTWATFPIKFMVIKRVLEASTSMAIVKMEREAATAKKAAEAKAQEEENRRASEDGGSEARASVLIKVKPAPQVVRYPEKFTCGEYLHWFFRERTCCKIGRVGEHNWSRLMLDPIISWVTIHFIFGDTTLALSQFITWHAGTDDAGIERWLVAMHTFRRISIFVFPIPVFFVLMLKAQLTSASGVIELRMSRGATRWQALAREWSIWFGLLVYSVGILVIWTLVCVPPAERAAAAKSTSPSAIQTFAPQPCVYGAPRITMCMRREWTVPISRPTCTYMLAGCRMDSSCRSSACKTPSLTAGPLGCTRARMDRLPLQGPTCSSRRRFG